MNIKSPLLQRLLIACLVGMPVGAWALYKPMRLLAPELVPGVTCIIDVICMDDAARYAEAVELYDASLRYVATTAGEFEKSPRITFCATQACYESFGFDRSSASSVGTSGIVVGPKGWQAHYIRHEMIHHLQAERLGVIRQQQAPEWLVEGMAYSLSGDPRVTLGEPMQGYRQAFDTWLMSVGRKRMWDEVRRL